LRPCFFSDCVCDFLRVVPRETASEAAHAAFCIGWGSPVTVDKLMIIGVLAPFYRAFALMHVEDVGGEDEPRRSVSPWRAQCLWML